MSRPLAAMLAAVLLLVQAPAPSYAVSTATEVRDSKKTDEQITAQQGVVGDRLLNAWVNRVAAKLWVNVGRKDVPYSVKILDESDVNAFTTGGGFIYVNEGTLDFVQSDDELAGVIGHETGHNERRHPITLRQRSEILSILFSLAAIFAPMTFGLGAIAQEGLVAKQARTDEYQADRYGLELMTRAGYDPDAMVSFMQRLGEAHAGEQVDRYFADHPGVPDRIRKLRGYPELAPATRTVDILRRQAFHDATTARFSVAAAQLSRVLAKRPNDAASLLSLGRMQAALGFPARAEQSYLRASIAATTASDRNAAAAAIAALHTPTFAASAAASPADRAALAQAQADVAAASRALVPKRTDGLTQVSSLQAHLQTVSNDAVSLDTGPEANDRETVRMLEGLGRLVNATLERCSNVLDGTGSLEAGREGGLLADNVEILREITELVNGGTLPPSQRPVIAAIGRMLGELQAGDRDARDGVDNARGALRALDEGLDRLDALMRGVARVQLGGDRLDGDARLAPLEEQARTSLEGAFAQARLATQAYNRARARGLETRMTLLGASAPPVRMAALRHALELRAGTPGPSPRIVATEGLGAGEIAAAAIVAADTGRTADDVVLEARRRGVSVIDLIGTGGGDAEALEIFLGLVYLDYTDELPKGG